MNVSDVFLSVVGNWSVVLQFRPTPTWEGVVYASFQRLHGRRRTVLKTEGGRKTNPASRSLRVMNLTSESGGTTWKKETLGDASSPVPGFGTSVRAAGSAWNSSYRLNVCINPEVRIITRVSSEWYSFRACGSCGWLSETKDFNPHLAIKKCNYCASRQINMYITHQLKQRIL